MKSWVYRAAASEPLLAVARQRAAGRGIAVFMYHDIGDDVDHEDAWAIVRKSHFREHVAYLRRHYELLDLDAALDLARSGRRLKRPAAVLTFDDGLRGNHTHLLPMVRELKLPVTIYVATGQVEQQTLYWFDRIANILQGNRPVSLDLSTWGLGRLQVNHPPGAKRWAEIQAVLMAVKSLDPAACDDVALSAQEQVRAQLGEASASRPLTPMTIDMVRELAAEPLVTLGGHSHGHEVLPLLSTQDALESVRLGREKLSQWIGRPIRHFAYPAGRNDATTRAMVADLGFETAMGTQNGLWNEQSDLMEIPRISVGRYDNQRKFMVHAVGGLSSALGR